METRPSSAHAAAVWLTAVTVGVSGCGGGGGEPLIRETTWLNAYRYELSQSAASPDRLALAVQWDGARYVFDLRFPRTSGLTGRYDRGSGVISIASGSELTADASPEVSFGGALQTAVTADITWMPGGEFESGTWTVAFADDIVRVDVASGAAPGVNLGLNGGATVFLGWQEFAGVFAPGSSAPAWQQAASAAFGFLRFAMGQVDLAFTTLEDAARVSFTNTPDVSACDRLSGAPPPGVLNQGERVLTWLGSADLGFHLRFTDCWANLAGEAQDYLYDGEIELARWRAVSDLSNRLVSLSFGSVTYLDLGLAGTVPNASGGIDLDSAQNYTLSGGFAVGFHEP